MSPHNTLVGIYRSTLSAAGPDENLCLFAVSLRTSAGYSPPPQATHTLLLLGLRGQVPLTCLSLGVLSNLFPHVLCRAGETNVVALSRRVSLNAGAP